MKKEQIK